mmetsp:Transcript_23305/g.39489  ORF Transcript_23305/g.39489 Transcript_23305/m.39489 type:complete len:220 (+) Transcript_23305:92-751(+)|eukprot:CAMPEP_0114432210 /NCGR_PEP_ID=MMETSP0103-20121206/11033_1 /TAXON_ID=37642 ORGANISM="Paraphysomonas imperforata, Strain PA2" /NCGR_SAMPLE_ID=MMETSP0103 /ASSEMBLY_ACC=CAM_ASM_000201 /LENGTH=219 /DNA_ID=CAMNT_0001601869 /DNA_START=87 /DNA_END=746 /DNA_ORIENTATION=+
MGGGSSKPAAVDLAHMSAKDFGEAVGKLGKNFIPYKKMIIDNGLSGTTIVTLSVEEFDTSLTEIGITSSLHKKAIIAEAKRLETAGQQDKQEQEAKQKKQTAAKSKMTLKLPKDFEVSDCVLNPPRDTFDALFKIQGVSYNAKEENQQINLEQIASLITASGCDGVNEYDCFISYRVSTDLDVAETIYNFLKEKNIQPFWDKKCLTPGLPWKQGFMQGE